MRQEALKHHLGQFIQVLLTLEPNWTGPPCHVLSDPTPPSHTLALSRFSCRHYISHLWAFAQVVPLPPRKQLFSLLPSQLFPPTLMSFGTNDLVIGLFPGPFCRHLRELLYAGPAFPWVSLSPCSLDLCKKARGAMFQAHPQPMDLSESVSSSS